MTEYEMVGHCGLMFKEFETCEVEGKGFDDLCTGCCMNEDETDLCESEDETDYYEDP
jgi:hypothetical protein